MTEHEFRIFSGVFAAAFVRRAVALPGSTDDAADDDAAVIAADLARRAVEAWRRLAKEILP